MRWSYGQQVEFPLVHTNEYIVAYEMTKIG